MTALAFLYDHWFLTSWFLFIAFHSLAFWLSVAAKAVSK